MKFSPEEVDDFMYVMQADMPTLPRAAPPAPVAEGEEAPLETPAAYRSIFVTLETSHLLTSPLKEDAPPNMLRAQRAERAKAW